MSVQTTYNFSNSIGSPGGIVDLAPHAIDTLINGEETGTMKLGVGVVQGDTPGVDAKLPTSDATASVFEGVTVNNRTTEYDLEGVVYLRKGAALGIMRYGRVYVRIATDVAITYGDPAYLIISGDEAGYFTNTSGDTTVAIKGRFLTEVDSNAQVATLELFNQAQE